MLCKVFTTLFGQVCAKYNISVPVLGSNSSANGTNVTFPSPSPTVAVVPYTGTASFGPEGCAVLVVVLAVGLALAMVQL